MYIRGISNLTKWLGIYDIMDVLVKSHGLHLPFLFLDGRKQWEAILFLPMSGRFILSPIRQGQRSMGTRP